jgi:hypothetical protein
MSLFLQQTKLRCDSPSFEWFSCRHEFWSHYKLILQPFGFLFDLDLSLLTNIMTLLIYLLNTVSQVDSLTALGIAATLLSSHIFYTTYFYPNFLSPLRHIPGPPNISKSNPYGLPFLGNTIDLVKEGSDVVHARWIDEYGGIVRYRELFGQESILLSDSKAIHQVLSKNSYDYIRPLKLARFLEPITGKENVFLAEGDIHKKQRKMIAPPFSHKNIKDMLPSIVGPCALLGEIWEKRANDPESKEMEFDIMEDLSRVTLDILGLAGKTHDNIQFLFCKASSWP